MATTSTVRIEDMEKIIIVNTDGEVSMSEGGVNDYEMVGIHPVWCGDRNEQV